MKSPHGFQATAAQVASLPQTVIPVARAPRQQSMKRISEANERDTSSREGSPGPDVMMDDEYGYVASIPLVPSTSSNRGSVLAPISEAQTSQDDYDVGYVRGTASSTSVGGLLETAMVMNEHYTEAGSEENTVIDDADHAADHAADDDEEEDDRDCIVENNNVVRIYRGVNESTSAFSRPPTNSSGGGFAGVSMSQVGSFPTMSPAESRPEHVTFSDKNQTVLLSPHRNAVPERPDPLARQPMRRSITEPLHGRYSIASSCERGDVTPGAVMSFSQPVAAIDHHYATPQNKTKQDFDAFLKTSQGASKHVLDNLHRIFNETTVELKKWIELEKANKNCSTNVSALSLESKNVVSAIMDTMPTCMPIPMTRSHSMPVFTGDISSTHPSNNGSSLFSMASHPSAMGSERLSYQGEYRSLQTGEVSLFHSGSGSGGSGGNDHFQLRCAASSPPKLRNSSLSRPSMGRESSDSSCLPMTMFFDGRDSTAHSIIGTPPQSDVSMTDMSLARRGSGGHLAAQDLLLFSHDGSRSSPAAQRALFAARHSGDYQKLVRKMKARAKLRRMSCKVRPTVSNQLFENSDTSLNMSVDEGVNASGFGNDHSGLSLSSIPVSTVTARSGATTSRRRLSMAFCALDDSFDGVHAHKRMANIAEEHSTLDDEDANHSHSYLATDPFLSSRQITDLAVLEKTLRRGVVVGGRFLYEWDNNTPVVVAPEGNEHRVDDVRLGESMELSLHVDIPGDMAGQWVELGADWHWANCNPLGYLVFCALPANRRAKATVYFLPKHPAQWNVFAAAAANQSQQSMLLDQSGMQDVSMIEGNNDNCFVMDGVEDALFHTSSPVSYAQAPRFFFPATSSSSVASGASLQHLPPWAVSHVFSYLHDEDIFASCLTLNKFWSLLAQVHFIPKRSDQLRRDAPDTCWERFKRFVVDYPRGKFLSDGAFKRVYAVRSAVHGRQDALSIMDVKDLEAREIEGVAKVEMEISLMCSLLATMKICPNMIKVHAMFQAEHDVTVWRPWAVESMHDLQSLPPVDAKTVYKKTFAAKKGRYQYCQMEFCSGGDVEELVRKEKVLGLEEVRSFLFQMFFAMYAARESLALRHYDIKLLNFFATNDVDSSLLPLSSLSAASTSPETAPSSSAAEAAAAAAPQMIVGFGKHLFRIDGSASHRPGIVKMADFGTSTVGSETLGTPITVQQFTTLENTPMEFLLLGGSARQSYASDTFCLGLSFLHLLTGFEPYEVLLADVRCPGVLKERLNEIWDEKQPGNPYHVIFMTIQSLQAPDDPELSTLSQDDTIQDILCDTLYRFFVLLGNSPYLESGFVRNPLYVQNPVWKALVDHLALEEKFTAPPVSHSGSLGSLFPAIPSTRSTANHFGHNAQKQQSRLTKQQALEQRCIETYRKDVRLYSIHTGEHQHLGRLRQRLEGLGAGAMDLLDRLLHFDPTQRCTMYDALHHPVFESLRIPLDGGDMSSVSLPPQTQQYLYYYNRRGHTSVDDGLPLL